MFQNLKQNLLISHHHSLHPRCSVPDTSTPPSTQARTTGFIFDFVFALSSCLVGLQCLGRDRPLCSQVGALGQRNLLFSRMEN